MLIRYSFAIGLKTCCTSSRFAASSSLRTVAASGTAEVIRRNRRRSAQTACSSDGAGREPTSSWGNAITKDPATGAEVEIALMFVPSAALALERLSDRRRTRRLACTRDVVAIPVEAVLRHALEGRIVDVDDPEPLRVPVRPLEVVEQTPDKVSPHGSASGDGARDSLDVRCDVSRSLRVVDSAIMNPNIAESGAVFGHVDRRWRIVARDAHQELVQPVRVHLPTHIRFLCVRNALHLRPIRAAADDESEVVVHAEEIDRGGDGL